MSRTLRSKAMRRQGLLGLVAVALGYLLGALTLSLAQSVTVQDSISISESVSGAPSSVTRMHGVLPLEVHGPSGELLSEQVIPNAWPDAGEAYLVDAWRGLVPLSNARFHGLATGGSCRSVPTAPLRTELAVSRPSTTPRRSVNQRLATMAPRTDAMVPVPSPTTTPHSNASCHDAVIKVVRATPVATSASDITMTRRIPSRSISPATNGPDRP